MNKNPSRYLDLLNDYSFKHVFGREEHKDILIAFLNALFEGEKVIVDLQYNPTEYLGENRLEKKVLFDLLCTDKNGDQFIIEMQRTKQNFFRDRSVLYMSRLISQQLDQGQNWNRPLKKIYLIAILEFALGDSDKGTYLQDIRLTNIANRKIFYPNTVYKFLELATFDNKEEYLKTNLEKWMFLLKNMHLLKKQPAIFNDAIFQKVFKIAEIAKLTKEERMLYERESIRKSDYEGGIAYAKEEGFTEGNQKGLVKGKRINAIEIACEMKKDGYPAGQIAKFTKLSIEEVENL